MKNFLVCLLLLSFGATAGTYECYVKGGKSEITAVAALKLPNFSRATGVLSLDSETCNYSPTAAYADLCRVRRHSVIIGNNPYTSFLLTSTGKTYQLCCHPEVPQEEQEEEEQEEQQEQQEEQEEEEQEGEPPGHGGSTHGPRGFSRNEDGMWQERGDNRRQ